MGRLEQSLPRAGSQSEKSVPLPFLTVWAIVRAHTFHVDFDLRLSHILLFKMMMSLEDVNVPLPYIYFGQQTW